MQVRKTAEFCGFQGLSGISWDGIGGGDGGIRTLDTRYQVWLLSRELVSATHPRLRMSHGRALPVARGAL